MREMSVPSKRSVSAARRTMPTSALMVVDLPAPLRPSAATASPRPIEKEMPWITVAGP